MRAVVRCCTERFPQPTSPQHYGVTQKQSNSPLRSNSGSMQTKSPAEQCSLALHDNTKGGSVPTGCRQCRTAKNESHGPLFLSSVAAHITGPYALLPSCVAIH